MPLKLYLQTVGQTKVVPGLEEYIVSNLILRDLPVHIKCALILTPFGVPNKRINTCRTALFHRRLFSRRLNDLLGVLRKLRLVRSQEEVPDYPI